MRKIPRKLTRNNNIDREKDQQGAKLGSRNLNFIVIKYIA